MLTNLFIRWGWSRDDWKWLWFQIVSVAAIITSGLFDVPYWCDYLGIPLSPLTLRWITALSALILWVSARHSATTLPSATAMASGFVPGSPAAKADDKIINSAKKYGPLVLVLVLVGGMTSGCAKMSPLQVIQVSHDSLATAQDLEAQLCWGVVSVREGPADRSHCTTPVSSIIGLTTERHQALNGKLATAFTLHKSLTAQVASGAAQVDFALLKSIINDILAIIGQLRPTAEVAQLTSAVKAGAIK